MKKFALFMVALIISVSAYAQQVSITNTTEVIVPPVVSDTSKVGIWQTGTVYAAGSQAKVSILSSAYVAILGGTSGTNSAVFSGTGPINDGTVIWQQVSGIRRNGFILNLLSGGTAVVVMNGGYFNMNAGDIAAFDNTYYQGTVLATSTSTNVFGVTIW